MDKQQQAEFMAELAIERLAIQIAHEKGPYSSLSLAASPRETARALYLLGWQPPHERWMPDNY